MNRIKGLLDRIPTGLLTGATLLLILWLTLAPHPTGDMEIELFPGADKVIHALMFGFLTFTACEETMKSRRWQPLAMPLMLTIAAAASCIGIGIEFAQQAMGLGRSMESLDIVADTAGAFLAALLWAAVQKSLSHG